MSYVLINTALWYPIRHLSSLHMIHNACLTPSSNPAMLSIVAEAERHRVYLCRFSFTATTVSFGEKFYQLCIMIKLPRAALPARQARSGTWVTRHAQAQFHTARRHFKPPTAAALTQEEGDNVKLGALGRTTSGQRLNIRTYPKFDRLEDERLYRKQHLAAAFRIFAERGFDEGVAGHISMESIVSVAYE
jgi:hypothetical protein